ncbi:MAG: maleylpyruvate isomerase N-terminal domain-containing protein [Chloroflexi bacterium]|nr:maleylpyruvate isomerase N-terminal domain-containing protein [Chloroflexota bacterium]
MTRLGELKVALEAEHDAFLTALESVDLELVTVPGIVEDWSVRDLVVHVAFWAEHAVEALALASAGHGDEFAYDTAQTDAMNARVLEESRRTSPAAAIEREVRAFDAFAAALDALDPTLLDLRLGNGDAVAEVIGYDGAAHYREHTAHLRAWFDEADAEDDDV